NGSPASQPITRARAPSSVIAITIARLSGAAASTSSAVTTPGDASRRSAATSATTGGAVHTPTMDGAVNMPQRDVVAFMRRVKREDTLSSAARCRVVSVIVVDPHEPPEEEADPEQGERGGDPKRADRSELQRVPGRLLRNGVGELDEQRRDQDAE